MRLLQVDTCTLEFVECDEPATQALAKYAVLSHTWNYGHEVLFEDIYPQHREKADIKQGYNKINHASKQAAKDGCEYLWVDTCCIDKRSSTELQEYALAAICYVYLEDVVAGPGWKDQFRKCRWFTRLWPLQELIAPLDVWFYDHQWNFLGNLREIVQLVSSITAIDVRLLMHKREPTTYSVAQRMPWAAKREASRVENIAYSLLGIFDVNMTMLYGEGTKAFRRLQEEIMRISTDHSIFAWERANCIDDGLPRGVLASSPADFGHCGRIGRLSGLLPGSFQLTNRGLKIPLPLVNDVSGVEGDSVLALLDCYRSGSAQKPYFGLELQPLPKLFNPRNYWVDPALFGTHATEASLVMGLRDLSEDDFRHCSLRFRAEKISLFGKRLICEALR